MTHRTPTLAAAVLLTLTAVPAPAQADPLGGSIDHQSPDNGYDAPFLVDCAGQTGWQRVGEGTHSDAVCDSEDVNRVKLRDIGERITCYADGSWFVWLDSGVRDVHWYQGLTCVNGLD